MAIIFRWVQTDEDRIAVYRFRYELYVDQQGLFQDEADHEGRLFYDHKDLFGHIVIAEKDGRVVGTSRINLGKDTGFSSEEIEAYQMHCFAHAVPIEKIALATRLLVAPQMRGGNISQQMNAMIFQKAIDEGMELALARSEPHLVGHHAKIGMRTFGRLVSHPTNGLLINLVMVLGDVAHFQQHGSALLPFGLKPKPSVHLANLLSVLEEGRAVVSEAQSDRNSYRQMVLEHLGVFRDLAHPLLQSVTTIDPLLEHSQLLTCGEGERLILKGHVSRTLYILLEGRLEVMENGRRLVSVSEKGTLVGEVAFFTNQQRMNDVFVGDGGARVLALNAGKLKRLLQEQSNTALLFMQYAVQQLCHKLKERAETTAAA